MNKSDFQRAALSYVSTTQPLDPDQSWRKEEVQLAFMAGMEALALPRLLSLPEAAHVLNVSSSTIHDLVRHGELAFVHAGRGTERRHLTFTQDEVESFIKRHTRRDSVPTIEPTATGGGRFLARREARRAAAKEAKKK